MPQTNILTGQPIANAQSNNLLGMNTNNNANNAGGVWGAVQGLGQAFGTGISNIGNAVSNWFSPQGVTNQTITTKFPSSQRYPVVSTVGMSGQLSNNFNTINAANNAAFTALNGDRLYAGTEAQQTVPYTATNYTQMQPQNWWDKQYGGMTLGQWGQLGMQGLGALNTFMNGRKMLNLAEDQLNLQKDAYERNFNMQQTNYNQAREDLYRSRSMMETDKQLQDNPDYLVALNGEQINNRGSRTGGSQVRDAQTKAVNNYNKNRGA